jgi:putative ABC transport system permease protein
MTIFDASRIALVEIRRNRMRSCLTALGIVIGVATFIVLVGLGRGATARLQEQVANLGANVILVERGKQKSLMGVRSDAGTAGTLTEEDAQAIATQVPRVIAVSPETLTSDLVMAGARNSKTKIRGEGADYFTIRRWEAAEGALFSEADVTAARLVTVLGNTVAEELFAGDDPVGQTVRVKNVPLQVIAVLKKKGTSLKGSDEDDVIFVPYTTALQRLAGEKRSLHRISIQAADENSLNDVKDAISALLTERHRISEKDAQDVFEVKTQLEIEEVTTGTSRTMTVMLGALAAVSLLVGGIGIMNIMLVSVSERTREIGVRIAVGARPRDILNQFLVESVWLSAAGGAAGLAIGAGASGLLTLLADWPVQVSGDSALLALAFSSAVGVAFGLYPARQGARMDPIVALRHD